MELNQNQNRKKKWNPTEQQTELGWIRNGRGAEKEKEERKERRKSARQVSLVDAATAATLRAENDVVDGSVSRMRPPRRTLVAWMCRLCRRRSVGGALQRQRKAKRTARRRGADNWVAPSLGGGWWRLPSQRHSVPLKHWPARLLRWFFFIPFYPPPLLNCYFTTTFVLLGSHLFNPLFQLLTTSRGHLAYFTTHILSTTLIASFNWKCHLLLPVHYLVYFNYY